MKGENKKITIEDCGCRWVLTCGCKEFIKDCEYHHEEAWQACIKDMWEREKRNEKTNLLSKNN